MQSRLQALGLTNPDAVIVDRTDGRVVVRSVDFKWSIETASYKQISAAALAVLLEHPESPLPGVLGMPQGTPPHATPEDGFFLAPDSHPNRAFLQSPWNARQEYPIEEKDVVLQVVDGASFFGALPWWSLAHRVAELDGMTQSLGTLDGAERYYRLGAGIGGALLKLRTPVFTEEPPALDVHAETEDFLRAHRLRTSLEAVEHLWQLMDQRSQRLRRARELGRCPYTFRALLDDLARRGVFLPDVEGLSREDRERWGGVHREVVRAHRAAVNAAGLDLMAGGQTETAALAELDGRRAEFELKAERLGRRLIARELTGS